MANDNTTPTLPREIHIGECIISPDHAAAIWRGRSFLFTRPRQREVMAVLVQQAQRGALWVSQDLLRDVLDFDALRVMDIFRDHDAIGTLILRDGKYYALAPAVKNISQSP